MSKRYISEWEVIRTRKVVQITERRQVENTDWISRFLVSLGFVSFKFNFEERVRYESLETK